MLRRGPVLLLLAIVPALPACAGTDTGITTTTTPATPGNTTFALSADDTGKRLLVRPGDEIIIRLRIADSEDPDWTLAARPDPSVLGGGDNLRFYPSEPDQGDAFHEFTFIAVGPGEATVVLYQGLITSEAPSLNFTIEVLAP
jgi:hypothetical protein